jgi:hypothetical protein
MVEHLGFYYLLNCFAGIKGRLSATLLYSSTRFVYSAQHQRIQTLSAYFSIFGLVFKELVAATNNVIA